MAKILNVKIINAGNGDYLLRQTKGGSGISNCGKYRFFIDEVIADPDFVVVRNKYIKSKTVFNVSPQNVILMTSEPSSIVNFPKHYTSQFGLYYSCDERAKHPNIHYGPAALPWFIGGTSPSGNHSITYDSLKHAPLPNKTKLISVITSDKAFTQGHQDRIEFVAKLKAKYGDTIEVFGRGIRGFKDKWEVLAPYKYHIAIENSFSNYYWTEKLSDCYLAGTFPIYSGCKNINDYFPQNGLEVVDIHDFDSAVAVIDRIIDSDIYQSRKEVLEQCRDLVLDRYNLFSLIADCCDRLDANAPKEIVSIHPSITILDWYNLKQTLFTRNYYALKHNFKKMFCRSRVLTK